MFKSNFNIDFRSTPKLEKSTVSMFVPVDQFDVQDFNLNDAGWPRNDIAQIARAQTYAEFQAIAARLDMLPNQSNLPKDCTLEEAYNLIKPSWCQTASELSDFCEFTNTQEFSRLQKKYARASPDGSKASPDGLKASPDGSKASPDGVTSSGS